MDYSGLKFSKGIPRQQAKRERLAAERITDKAARLIAWTRCQGRCETCHAPINRSGDLLRGAHFHHLVFRSHGGRRNPRYRVLCSKYHGRIHGQAR